MIPWSLLLSHCEGYHLVCARKWIRNWTSCFKQMLLKRCQKVRLAGFSFGSCTLAWWWRQDLCRWAAYTRSDYQRHPIPTVEELLHNLNRRAVFSKVDLKWGFWLIVACASTSSLSLRAARSIFVHAPGILNFHGDTHKLDSSNYNALVLTHFLAHLRCAH